MTEIKSWFRMTTVGQQIARARAGAVTHWMAEGIIIKGGSTLLYAPPGHGKSLVAKDFGLAASEGRLWLSAHSFGDPIHTVYLDDDGNNDHEFNARLLAFGAREDNEFLHCMLHQGFIVTDDAKREALLRYCKEQNVGLLIIDSLTRIHELAESSSGDMKRVSAAIKQFCLAGVTVVVLHHSTKGGATFRGSNEIASGFDGVLRLEKVDDNTFLLTNEKVRSVGSQGVWTGCRIVVAEDENGHLVLDGTESLGDFGGSSTAQEALRAAILDLLGDGDLHGTALKKALKLSSRDYPTFDAAVEWLLAEELLESYKEGKAVFFRRCADTDDLQDILGD